MRIRGIFNLRVTTLKALQQSIENQLPDRRGRISARGQSAVA
jgi:hypothetical protein